jgi:uncharacterized protein YeeX (DUF496 family)
MTVANLPKDWDEIVAREEARLGFKICAARTRDGRPCLNQSGKATDHFGEGRCRQHKGAQQSPLATSYKHGGYSVVKTSHPVLREKMEELARDHEVFNMEDEILKLRAITEIFAENNDFQGVAKNIVDTSKVIERLHNIQEGRKYVISIENVASIIETVKEAIFRHVPDEYTRRLIAQELTGIRLSGARPRMIEGRVLGASEE